MGAVVLVAIDFARKAILLAIQSRVLAPCQPAVITLQIVGAFVVESRLLALQRVVFVPGEFPATNALINTVLLTNFAIANFSGLSSNRCSNDCDAECRKDRVMHFHPCHPCSKCRASYLHYRMRARVRNWNRVNAELEVR